MPTYTVKDNETGKTIKFNWMEDQPPTDTDLAEVFKTANVSGSDWKQTTSKVGRTALEATGLVGGSLVGGATTGPIGAVPGGALGYGIGKKVADLLDAALGLEIPTLQEGIKETPKLMAEGAMMEMGGQVVGKAVPLVAKAGGQVLGKLTGTGEGAVQEAYKATPEFTKALRGKTAGEEIVENAKQAVGKIKEARGQAYKAELKKIAENKAPIEMKPIHRKLADLMDRYNVVVDPATQKIDTSRIAMNRKGRRDVLNVVKTVAEWNREGDNTAVGLDTLKRQLDDFYSESSEARAFVQSLRSVVKDTIVKSVPEYGQMTKGYADATRLIKDIEAGLMLRKQGMTGRIVADQTLRRLMSAMRESSGLRKELLDILGEKTGQELSQQVAGYTMKSLVPVGLSGTGPAIVGQAALAKFVSPAFWPALMMSSPRVAGEFVQMLGRLSRPMTGMAPVAGRIGAYETGKPERQHWIPELATAR